MHLEHATEIANRIVAILLPHCERIDIAGSIRRKQDEVNDIDIVCLPKPHTIPDVHNLDFLRALIKLDNTILSAEENYYQIELKQEVLHLIDNGPAVQIGRIKLDIYIPQPQDYFRQLALRTGSKNYSWLVISRLWLNQGWVGTRNGLRLYKECKKIEHSRTGYYHWQCIVANPTLPPAWRSEKEFFEWLGLWWIEPEIRC